MEIEYSLSRADYIDFQRNQKRLKRIKEKPETDYQLFT
jgi:hypothetical protein